MRLLRKCQEGGFLDFPRQLITADLPFIKNILIPLAKSVSIPLELMAAVLQAVIWKKILGSGTTELMISNEEMNDMVRIVKSLGESGLLIKGVSEVIKNETKEQNGGFLGMFLSTLSASLLGDLLEGRGITRGSERVNEAVKDYCVAVKQYNFILLTNFEIQKHYQNKPRFNGAYS